MIKKVKITNFAGIKEYYVDFELKSIRDKDKNLESQVIMDQNRAFSLFPTFIGSNASGKTSFVKALDFLKSFINKEEFIRKITNYAYEMITDNLRFLRGRELNGSMARMNTLLSKGTMQLTINDTRTKSTKMINDIFKEFHHSGSDKFAISLLLDNGKSASIQFNPRNSTIMMNGKLILINDIIYIGIKSTFSGGLSMNELWENIYKNIEHALKGTNFIDANLVCLYKRNNVNIVKSSNHYLERVNRHIRAIAKEYGFAKLMFLLRKIDSKIVNITENSEINNINIFMGKNNDLPVSTLNLSFGTKKVLEILAESIPLFKNGGSMVIDEIENGLHLSLIRLITEFYANEAINIANAQLIITTHNPLLFEKGIILPRNAYLKNGDSFVNIKELGGITRTEDMTKMLSTKNYFNDSFWVSNKNEIISTLTNINVTRTINMFASDYPGNQGEDE